MFDRENHSIGPFNCANVKAASRNGKQQQLTIALMKKSSRKLCSSMHNCWNLIREKERPTIVIESTIVCHLRAICSLSGIIGAYRRAGWIFSLMPQSEQQWIGFIHELRSYPVTNCCSFPGLLAGEAPNRSDIDETISVGYSAIYNATVYIDHFACWQHGNNTNDKQYQYVCILFAAVWLVFPSCLDRFLSLSSSPVTFLSVRMSTVV